MQNIENLSKITVVWRGNKYVVEMKSDASLKELGDELQKLTDVKSDTLRFIVPQSSDKSSKLLYPFSDEHSRLSLPEAAIMQNHGEEISLRLRTDDLKGFRKYDSIKKTLLHELAHMVFSEHDANFYALDRQLNQEAASLDWTKSRGHSLSGISHLDDDEEEEDYVADSKNVPHKLGGNFSDNLASARAASVAAAYRRFADASSNSSGESNVHEEPDPDDSMLEVHNESKATGYIEKESMDIEYSLKAQNTPDHEPDPDEQSCGQTKCKPDSNVSSHCHNSEIQHSKIIHEPDPDDVEAKKKNLGDEEPKDSLVTESFQHHPDNTHKEPDPDSNKSNIEPDPDAVASQVKSSMQIDEPDPDDQELRRIQDPVTVVCGRLKKAIESLRAEVSSTEVTGVLSTLLKIIRNVIEHPDNMKFKRLRKANPAIQKNIANHQAAIEILLMIGFIEEATFDQIGRPETYLVLKRNDPGLLWLAKSSLETEVAL
ncbi:hypothetical protein Tsubulata_048750 [Turnera subulata]|uniref:WLM domain-containing protein n=1 Tax=Turnera subulata TaxID=218843 RepID=A0A9Q0J6N4_9ROSI|nr:hypothetical protein Tsubulata_048750 [Turnera subulata]